MKISAILVAVTALAAAAVPASASTINWAQWSSTFTTGSTTGAATGTFSTTPTITVGYSGQVATVYFNYPSWTPTATFDAGMNAPQSAGGIIRLTGGSTTGTNAITFSQPVTDPYIAIWSLGAGGNSASFNFIGATPTILSGGPSAEYGGSTITQSGNDILGAEGNGTIGFTGTFTSISWTNPTYESWYGFTVGVAGPATAVPEPATLALFAAGLGLLGFGAVRRRKNKAG